MPTRRVLSRGEGGSQSETDGARTKWADLPFPPRHRALDLTRTSDILTTTGV